MRLSEMGLGVDWLVHGSRKDPSPVCQVPGGTLKKEEKRREVSLFSYLNKSRNVMIFRSALDSGALRLGP